MASFLGNLKAILGTIVQVGQLAEPEIALFNPPLAATVDQISKDVLKAEVAFQAPDSGPQKLAYVVTSFTASLELVRAIEAQYGRTITVPDKLLQDAIAAEVSSKNAYAALQAGITIIPIPKS